MKEETLLKRLTKLSILAVSLSLALPVAADDSADANTIVATVNGTEITLGHMILARQALPEQYSNYPAEMLFKGLLDQLVQQVLLAQSTSGEVTVRTKLELENQRRMLLAGSAIDKVMAKEISENDIEQIYQSEYAIAESGAEYNASHILVEAEESALALTAALESGADFAELAKEKSTGPSGPNGGQLGWFGAGMMVPEFEQAVKALDVGAVSAPIQTQFGWHVIKLNDSRAMAAPTLPEVRGEIELRLRQTKTEAHIQGLVAEAQVTRVEDGQIDPELLLNQALLD
jgi:peptidyl-prolyl cis-trans isomerase C